MSKMTKVIAGLGVVAGLGVAALPLSTYAAIPAGSYGQEVRTEVQTEVTSAVSIASSQGGTPNPATIDLGTLNPGAMTADMADPLTITVTSNQANAVYRLYINTTATDGAMAGEETGAKIPAMSDNNAIAAGNSAWGYMYSTSADFSGASYNAVPTDATVVAGSPDPATINGAAGTAQTSNFKFQASASTTQPADIYKAEVVFTAVVQP